MKKFLLIFFLTVLFLGTFGVKNSWAQQACCNNNWLYNQSSDTCYVGNWDPITNPGDPTNCIGMQCVPNGSTGVCNAGATAIPVPTAPVICQPGGGFCVTRSPSITGNVPFDPCKNLTGSNVGDPLRECRSCTGIDAAGKFTACLTSTRMGASCGTWTSLGCIPNDPPELVGYVLRFGSGIAGGIAFLLILFGASQIVMSGGVPEKIAAGKEVITSAVIGLVFIFVSVLILQIIGVKIIGIPGWT
jgi:hypothetical protein